MTTLNKSILAALVGAIALLGAVDFADAGPHHGWRGSRHGAYGPGPCYAQDISPEQRQMMEEAYQAIAPLQLELRAKRQELTAKIYGGADDKAIQAVADQVKALEARLGDARLGMQKNFAKSGVPMGRGGCPGYGPGHAGHGYGGPGYGGPGYGGYGPGYDCPGYGPGHMRHGYGCPGYGPGPRGPRGMAGDNVDGPSGQSAE